MTPEEEQQLREILVSGLYGGEEDVPEGASLLTIATALAAMSRRYQRYLRRWEDEP